MAEQTADSAQPAFYARSGGGLAQWWTLLHPPYTGWHLSYVVLGTAVVPEPDFGVLALTVLAFALAMGVGAHALDELNGRPLGTGISDRALWCAAVASVAAAVALGVLLAVRATPALWPLVVAGSVLVAGYNLELFGGRLHTPAGFALSWGAFPAVTGYVAQDPSWSVEGVLALTVLAFALAMGVGAHALDELNGRPLGTGISDRALWSAAVASVTAAVALGALLAVCSTPALWPLVVVGPVLVAGYNLELFGGRLHNLAGFALSWGAFPAVTGYVAQDPSWSVEGVLAALAVAAAATLLSVAQRRLSTPARDLRRRTAGVEGTVHHMDGTQTALDRSTLLAPFEGALRALCWAVPLTAAGALVARLGG